MRDPGYDPEDPYWDPNWLPTYLTVENCNLEGKYVWPGGVNIISEDPEFIDAENGDYRIADTSPSRDAGSNELVPDDEYDIDEDPQTEVHPWDLERDTRIVCIVDHGVFEVQEESPSDCPADLNGDGEVDVLDMLILFGAWGPCPGHCPADLNCDGVVDILDNLLLFASWGPCNNFTSEPVPQWVEDCLNLYEIGSAELEACLLAGPQE